jgi:predicted TIM-barrel fold metal-dependent hydrolase
MHEYLVISSDCHAGANGAEYRPYVDPDRREAFDEFLAFQIERMPAPPPKEATASLWDIDVRVRYLDAERLAGEVIFPQPGGASGPPFYSTGHSWKPDDQELTAAGTRAYNRWLADFVASSPDPKRHAGVAQITQLHDIDAAVAEVEWAVEHDLRGGVLIRSQPEGARPGFNHPRYEPLWSVCEETGMVVHTHGGEVALGQPIMETFTHPGAMAIFFTEVTWFGHRPLWYLIWSGVLERHPRLKLAFTEQLADWVPDVLFRMDSIYDRFARRAAIDLPLRPSEYWTRQCYVGSSLMTRRETDRRYEIGVGNIMWGTDFPHDEGTYPHSEARLHEAFDGLDETELRAMLGETAAGVYGFDRAHLASLVDEIGLPADYFEPVASRGA